MANGDATQRVTLRDSRSSRPIGIIPLAVLEQLGITIHAGACWFTAEQMETIHRHPDWEDIDG